METIAPGAASSRAILVIHSWWRLTQSFRDYGASLAKAGYFVGLADLFDGETADTESEARALRARPRRVPIYKTLAADIAALRERAGSADARIGLVGFSMGGHWAVWLSQRSEYAVAATSLYYAARGGSYAECKAGIIAHFAERDPWVSASARRGMEHAIRQAGCGYEAFDYPRTGHWFAETAQAGAYDASAARQALDRDLRHFETHLKPAGGPGQEG